MGLAPDPAATIATRSYFQDAHIQGTGVKPVEIQKTPLPSVAETAVDGRGRVPLARTRFSQAGSRHLISKASTQIHEPPDSGLCVPVTAMVSVCCPEFKPPMSNPVVCGRSTGT